MPNSFFQFKKFRINQDKSAMKVCTDACLFGAYIRPEQSKKILDIGTGTGLLTLMIAQRTNAAIDAVEIEINAFEQAKENFQESPWKEKLKIFHTSIQDYQESKNYDLIICNPPFFSNNLKSPVHKKNIALHSESLSFSDLIENVIKLLDNKGTFYILLPEYEFELFNKGAEKSGMIINETCIIRNRKDADVLRVIGKYSFQDSGLIRNEIIIKDENGEYTGEFKKLLRDYYLNL